VGSRSLLVILHGKRVDDDLLRNALLELKQQGHQVPSNDASDMENVQAETYRAGATVASASSAAGSQAVAQVCF
jgi:hypothetical protein